MLNTDLQLKNDATLKRRRRPKAQSGEEEASFHFIAFVPVECKLWKLDGLQPQPQNLGKGAVAFVYPITTEFALQERLSSKTG